MPILEIHPYTAAVDEPCVCKIFAYETGDVSVYLHKELYAAYSMALGLSPQRANDAKTSMVGAAFIQIVEDHFTSSGIYALIRQLQKVQASRAEDETHEA